MQRKRLEEMTQEELQQELVRLNRSLPRRLPAPYRATRRQLIALIRNAARIAALTIVSKAH